MPRSGCSALHGVNPIFLKKCNFHWKIFMKESIHVAILKIFKWKWIAKTDYSDVYSNVEVYLHSLSGCFCGALKLFSERCDKNEMKKSMTVWHQKSLDTRFIGDKRLFLYTRFADLIFFAMF